MSELRWYQSEAVHHTYEWMNQNPGNPVIELPTGAGKTHVLAKIAGDIAGQWGRRCIIVSHVRELVEQSFEKLRAAAPGLPIGIYSAGLGRKETEYAVTIASIQSIYKQAFNLGQQTAVLIDEAHLIPFDGDGMYRSFIDDLRRANPLLRVIGLTATPYRTKGAGGVLVYGEDKVLTDVSYRVGVRELISQGYLSPVKSKKPRAGVADVSGVRKTGTDYVQAALEEAMNAGDTVEAACAEILFEAQGRRSILVFAAGRKHAAHIAQALADFGERAEVIDGETPGGDRDRWIGEFKRGELRVLVNVNVLTTGFDAPNIDCVAMLRPTLSPGLYYQMVGRGFRLCEGKADCLVLDFAGNVARHGPVDELRGSRDRSTGGGSGGADEAPAKECPECRSMMSSGFAACPDCGYVFPPPPPNHDRTASTDSVLGTGQPRWERVIGTQYAEHVKAGAGPDAPRSIRVEYQIGFTNYVKEWVCVEHSGFARTKAEAWWSERSLDQMTPVPPSEVDQAIGAIEFLKESGAWREPARIAIQKDSDGFEKIVAIDWNGEGEDDEYEKTVAAELVAESQNFGIEDLSEDDIPF